MRYRKAEYVSAVQSGPVQALLVERWQLGQLHEELRWNPHSFCRVHSLGWQCGHSDRLWFQCPWYVGDVYDMHVLRRQHLLWSWHVLSRTERLCMQWGLQWHVLSAKLSVQRHSDAGRFVLQGCADPRRFLLHGHLGCDRRVWQVLRQRRAERVWQL